MAIAHSSTGRAWRTMLGTLVLASAWTLPVLAADQLTTVSTTPTATTITLTSCGTFTGEVFQPQFAVMEVCGQTQGATSGLPVQDPTTQPCRLDVITIDPTAVLPGWSTLMAPTEQPDTASKVPQPQPQP